MTHNPSNVDPGPGWRLLHHGETIPSDAEFYSPTWLLWIRTAEDGNIINEGFKYTYRTKTPEPKLAEITKWTKHS